MMEKIPHEGRGALNMYSMTYDEHLLILKKLDEMVDWINNHDEPNLTDIRKNRYLRYEHKEGRL